MGHHMMSSPSSKPGRRIPMSMLLLLLLIPTGRRFGHSPIRVRMFQHHRESSLISSEVTGQYDTVGESSRHVRICMSTYASTHVHVYRHVVHRDAQPSLTLTDSY